ncbi:unnamed protein product [Durusdinium trenchii]|uniref:Anaphase-promoting complex subunit 5 n=1 Tax=Durusdinium trenchii TaxID=1381693 RepID=A0ABP0NV53_9DINO
MKLSDLRPLPSVYLLKASQRVSRIYEKLDLGLYEEAQALAEDLGEAESSTDKEISPIVLSDVHRLWGDLRGALDLAEEAAASFSQAQEQQKAAALVALSRARAERAGQRQEPETLAQLELLVQEAQQRLHQGRPPDPALAEGFGHLLAAEAAMATEDWAKASHAAKAAIACFRLRDEVAQAAALLLMGLAGFQSNAPREAVSAANLAAAACRAQRKVWMEAASKRLGHLAHWRLKETQQAAQLAEEMLLLVKAAGTSVQQVEALLETAEAHLVRVKQREANAQRSSLVAWASRAFDLAGEALTLCDAKSLRSQACARLLRAKAALQGGFSLAQALEDAEEARLLMNDVSERRGVASALLLQAEVNSLEGRTLKASSLVKEAQALSEDLHQADLPVLPPAAGA